MTILRNEITINAPLERIWTALTEVETLEKYDPTVRKSTATTAAKSGTGASRRVDMLDGKNWFEEQCTVSRPQEVLTYELRSCSFPVHALKHSYSFEHLGDGRVKVKQIMEYRMKFGILGKIMDALMVRKQSDKGIKAFMAGLKSFTENS